MTERITVSRELLRQVLEGIKRSRCTAMIQTLTARIPESGLFGGIAQDLDFVESKLCAALEQPAVEPYGWHVTGSNELLRGEYAQSDAESDAKRYGGTARAVALYTAPPPPADVPLLTEEEIASAVRHLFQNETVQEDAAMELSNDEYRAIEQAVRQKAGLK